MLLPLKLFAVSPNILKVAKLDGNLFNKLEPDRLYEMETGEAPFVKSDPSSIRSLRDVYCPCPQFMNGDITMPQVVNMDFIFTTIFLICYRPLNSISLQKIPKETKRKILCK